MKTIAKIIIVGILLSSGCVALSPYDQCERDAIAQKKHYTYNVKLGHYVEAHEALGACSTDTECESAEQALRDAERALDEIEAEQE